VVAVSSPGAFGAGTVLWQDNFNSYANQGAMLSVYNGNGSTGSPSQASIFDLGVPSPDAGNTTQSVNYHDMPASGSGVPNLAKDINTGATPIKATDATPILWQYDFYWDGAGNKRVSGGLRNPLTTGSETGILEMGYYNSAYNPITALNGSGFAVRTTFLPGSGTLPEGASLSGWRLLTNADGSALLGSAVTAPAWIRFSALIRGHSIEYTADVNRDGTIDSSYIAASPSLDVTNALFNSVRLGGPSGLSSAGGGAYFDNLLVETAVPGDANLNGKIDPDDYALIDRNFGKAVTGWAAGDFNGDGTVDLNDYLVIDTSFGQQGGQYAAEGLIAARSAEFGAAYAAALAVAVPEPATLGAMAVLASAATLGRRRRGRD
jgi:hypothetical protein